MVVKEAAADSVVPMTQMRLALNMDSSQIGSFIRRRGYSRVGSAAVVATKPILGLFHHVGTNSQLIAFSNDAGDANAEAYYLSGGTWTNEALGFTAGTEINAITFLDYVFAVNGTDSPKSWDGNPATNWGTTNLVSAPTGSLIETYKQQVFIGDTSTDTVYFSSIPTAGAITWDTVNDNFIVNPNDGSSLTAMIRYGQELLFFKDDYLYRYNSGSLDPDPVIFSGTPSQKSVIIANTVCWFYSAKDKAIYGYSGGYPEKISDPVKSFVQAIPSSSETSVVAWKDDESIEFYIGDVTVNSRSYTNVGLRYHISTQTWTVREYANDLRRFATYNDGTDRTYVMGDAVGDVVTMEDGNDDLGTNIGFELETAWLTTSDNPRYKNRLSRFSTFIDNSLSTAVFYKTDLDDTWREIGTCSKFVNDWRGINADFHRIKYRFVGYNNSGRAEFDGFAMETLLITTP